MRKDAYVSNDSGAWSLAASSALENIVDDDRSDDGQFVKAQQAVLASLVGDDSFVARVVVGEPLTAAEQEEWIAHFRTALDVPCGKLVVAGGFDPSVFADYLEQGTGANGIAEFQVPPGRYLVDVYTYLHSMNGRVIVGDVWEEKLGAWFRRDHPGREYPSWVAGELVRSPDEDPGHEKVWQDVKAAVARGDVKVSLDPLDWVTFLVHLQPFDPSATLDEPAEGDWFAVEQGLRRPARFPLGIPAFGAEDPEVRGDLEDLLEPKRAREMPEASGTVVPVDVFFHAEDHDLVAIDRGPVALSLDQLARIVRLGWFAVPQSHPEVRIEADDSSAVYALFDGLPGVSATFEQGAVRVGWPETGGLYGSLKTFQSVPADRWAQLPDGTRLEVATAVPEPDPDGEPTVGLTRFRGTVGRGVWQIREAYPRVSAATLRDALELAACHENARRLTFRDADETQRVMAAFVEQWGDVLTHDDPPKPKGAEIHFEQNDGRVGLLFGVEAFRLRYADTWPVMPRDDDEDDE